MKINVNLNREELELLKNIPKEYRSCIDCNKYCSRCSKSEVKYITPILRRNPALNEFVDVIFKLINMEVKIKMLEDKAISIMNKYTDETQVMINDVLKNILGGSYRDIHNER